VVINGSATVIPVSSSQNVEFSRRYHPEYPGKLTITFLCHYLLFGL
jgi:hypothetical protein